IHESLTGGALARAVDREGGFGARLPAAGVARNRRPPRHRLVRLAPGRADEARSRHTCLMRIIVTGASGFIGRNVLLRAPREWDIIALYHRTADLEAFVAHHALRHVRVMRCNLLDAADVQAVVNAAGGRADAVLYLAANGDPAASATRPR